MAENDNQSAQASYEKPQDIGKTPADFVKAWVQAIELSSKEEEAWRKDGDDAIKTYRVEKDAKDTDFNILYANVETVVPALYNSTPAPDVRRRYGDKDQTAKQVSDVLERFLSYSADKYDLDSCMVDAVQDMALPGRGLVRVRFDQTKGAWCEYVPWALFRVGPAKTWADVPWIGFCLFLGYNEILQLVDGDKAKADLIPLNYTKSDEKTEKKRTANSIFRVAQVWEIWDKTNAKVYFICPSYKDDVIAEIQSPLDLEAFFPVPRPLYAIKTTDKLCPVSPHKTYLALRTELNDITGRIRRLIKQLRVRAMYGGNATDTAAWAQADDGEIIKASDTEWLNQAGGLDKALAWWPLDPIVKALQQLYVQREQIKQTIYEVAGVSDIQRGATDPRETMGAQEIKSQWGTLRLQRQQAEVQRFCRDLFRLLAEIAASHLSIQDLSEMTGIQLDPMAAQLIQSDKLRSFRVDIETDSTIRADLTRSQENMTQFLQGTAQFIQGAAAGIQTGLMPLDVIATVYASFARQFKLGKQAEDALEGLIDKAQQAAQQPQPDPEAEKAKAQLELDQQKQQADIQATQQKQAADIQGAQQKQHSDMQAQMATLQMNQQAMQQEAALKMQEMQMKLAQMQQEMQIKREVAQQDMQINQDKAEQAQKIAADSARVRDFMAMNKPQPGAKQ